jgi:hypothetical protein
MKFRPGVTCQISSFEVPNPPLDPEAIGRKWLAVATAHVYDPNAQVPGLKPEEVVFAGETMRVISGRAYAPTEADAMRSALEALLFQLTAKGFSSNQDVKGW